MMPKRIIGVIDYGVGNLASVVHALRAMGYSCRVSQDRNELAESDLLLLPGVGAFPTAMVALHELGLVQFIQNQARSNKPIVGICLGMQLLAESSTEIVFTSGLSLIPGKVESLGNKRWHIGWNSIEVMENESMLMKYDGQTLYFNHSFIFLAPREHQMAVARLDPLLSPITIAVRRNNVVGLQFHPEKSQATGRQLLANVIEELCCA